MITIQFDEMNKDLMVEIINGSSKWMTLSPQTIINPFIKMSSGQLAYIIYTSGSTGIPKGALGTHQASINRFTWMWMQFPFNDNDITCQKTSLNFVDSIWEIFGSLLKGIPLVIASQLQARDPYKLLELIERKSITRLVLVPSLLKAILDIIAQTNLHHIGLNTIIVSGEYFSFELALQSSKLLPTTKLLNLYGSSEVAGDSIYSELFDLRIYNSKNIPIGYPIFNTQIYLLDEFLAPVPIGITGEIYIGGVGLARGYLNQPSLTAEKFIPNLFINSIDIQDAAELRLYKTGDLGRYLPDGNIEFLGRKDAQVKIRGFRIELKEIESVLVNYEEIDQAVVKMHEIESNNKILIAYLVLQPTKASFFDTLSEFSSAAGQSISILSHADISLLIDDIKKFLAKSLLGYMIPTYFIVLDKIPLTPNGKTDYKALPAQHAAIENLSKNFVAPYTKLEQELATIWSDILKIEKISIEDNFFKLGGHSLLATQIVSKINKKISKKLSLIDIFKYPTIDSLVKYIELDFKKNLLSSIMPIQVRGGKRPLFLIHPIGGASFCYTRLADYINCTPIYAINNPAFEDPTKDFKDISEMASVYIKLIKQIQSEGPYVIGGWSFGGLVAYEIAQQLHAQNEQVGSLIMIDVFNPKPDKNYFTNNEIINSSADDYIHDEDFLLSEFIDLKTKAIIKRNLISCGYKIDNYQPYAFPGTAVLLKAKDNKFIDSTVHDYRWKEYIPNLEIMTIPGEHGELFNPEYIETTAEGIRAAIRK